MTELDALPSILRSKHSNCFLMVHVDDLLTIGSRDAVMKQLVPSLQSKYAISIKLMSKHGNHLFETHHELFEAGRIVIRVHHKHLDQLQTLASFKETPMQETRRHSEMEIPDRSAELGHQDASMYRTCVGILLYLLVDLPQCQYVIRYLPTFSSKPTEKSLMVLKDPVDYMGSTLRPVPCLC